MEIQYASCAERLTQAKPCETLTFTQRRTPQGVADLDRNRWPTSIRIGGRLPSEKPADIIGIPTSRIKSLFFAALPPLPTLDLSPRLGPIPESDRFRQPY